MTAGVLLAMVQQIVVTYGQDVEVSLVDPETGARQEFHIEPSIGEGTGNTGRRHPERYMAVTPGA